MQLRDRRPLGRSGLTVSPICLGVTKDPDTITTAFDAGVNFFFLSADLHWPMYEHTRRGLRQLFARPGVRDQVVVGVVSYLAEPLFHYLQFHEVLDDVPGLERVDLLIAGAVSSDDDCYSRLSALEQARGRSHCGARAIGASFHSRIHALAVGRSDALDVSFVRYNTLHRGARRDLFPFLPSTNQGLAFGFKAAAFHPTDAGLDKLGLTNGQWRPHITDSYRFALSHPALSGLLAAPDTPAQFRQLGDALEKGPLGEDEQEYLMALSQRAHAATAG